MTRETPSLMTLRIICFALLTSVFIYAGIAFFVLASPDPGQVSNTSLLLPLASMAGLAVVTLPALRKMLLGTLALPFLSGEAGAPPQWTPEVERAALLKYTTGSIVGYAVAESVAIFGLVASFLAQDPMLVVPFAATSVLLIGVQFPSEAGMRAVAAANPIE
jgi:hypothetical protein